MALTVGVGTVMEAREVLIIITGHAKAYALYKVVEEGVNHMWTVSMVQLHEKSVIGEFEFVIIVFEYGQVYELNISISL